MLLPKLTFNYTALSNLFAGFFLFYFGLHHKIMSHNSLIDRPSESKVHTSESKVANGSIVHDAFKSLVGENWPGGIHEYIAHKNRKRFISLLFEEKFVVTN